MTLLVFLHKCLCLDEDDEDGGDGAYVDGGGWSSVVADGPRVAICRCLELATTSTPRPQVAMLPSTSVMMMMMSLNLQTSILLPGSIGSSSVTNRLTLYVCVFIDRSGHALRWTTSACKRWPGTAPSSPTSISGCASASPTTVGGSGGYWYDDYNMGAGNIESYYIPGVCNMQSDHIPCVCNIERSHGRL